MPFSIVNGAPPQQTEIADSRGRVTAPWFAYFVGLQRANSGVTVGLGGLDLAGQTVSGAGVFSGSIRFALAPIFTDQAGTRAALGLGSAATHAAADFDAAGAAAAAQAAAIAASLQRASNLSDLANAATARTNLGLGSAALNNTADFDAAGAATAAQAAAIAASLQRASNLSDLANAATARTNLGLGSAATQNTTAFDAAGAAAALLASANTWAAAATFSAAVTFSAPASIAFGSGWLSWTPTITGSGSMTVSAVTVAFASYLQIGALCMVEAAISFTTGGTLAPSVLISLPLNYKGASSLWFAAATFASTGVGSVINGVASLAANSPTLTLYAGADSVTNYSASAHSAFLRFAYRVG